MNFKKIAIILLMALVVWPGEVHAQGSNAGFVPGNIWYSQDPFEEGDKIKIYTLIFNPDERELSGTVIFFDNSVFLGKKDFIVSPKGTKDISIDWTVTVGTHKIFGKIENSKFLISGEGPERKYEEVYLAGNQTQESIRTVSKKIIQKTEASSEEKGEGVIVNAVESLKDIGQNIGDKIIENTPEVVSRTIIISANTVETFRQDWGAASENKKEKVKNSELQNPTN